jgi:molecular chaperone DnaK (HSP70)
MFVTTVLLWLLSVTRCHGFLAPAIRGRQTRGQTRLFATEKDEIGVGIDLGTTNSAIAFLDGDTPEIIEIPNNGRTMKSVVAFDESGKAFVGNEALEWEMKTSIGAYRHVKRVIGTGVNSLSKETRDVVPHLPPIAKSYSPGKKSKKKPTLQRILQDAQENPTMLFSLLKGEFGKYNSVSPEVISAAILKRLLDVATDYTDKKITRAVIGVPAYFNDEQREATIRAAKLAGVEKVKLLREPEAAALAYGVDKDTQEEELVLVFDLGGGTYDVSVLLVETGLTEIVCTSGNAQLGGSNFDAKIAKRIAGLVKNCCRSDDSSDMIVRAAEAIRIYLSNNRRVELALPITEEGWIGLGDPDLVIVTNDETFEAGASNSTHTFVHWTRKEVESLCLDELLLLLRPIREVAIMAGALLPGDSRPSVVASAIELQDAFLDGESFYEDDNQVDEIPVEVQQEAAAIDFKDAKKAQQKGRKKARQVAKDERKYRAESRIAAELPAATTDTRVRADGISGRPIRRVVLVGGATRMPAVGRLISALTGCTPQKTVDPDEAVALGCAVHVGVLDGKQEMGTVLNPMQAALLRAVVEKQRRDGELDDIVFDDDDEIR